jgi:hypothetical protein
LVPAGTGSVFVDDPKADRCEILLLSKAVDGRRQDVSSDEFAVIIEEEEQFAGRRSGTCISAAGDTQIGSRCHDYISKLVINLTAIYDEYDLGLDPALHPNACDRSCQLGGPVSHRENNGRYG